MMGARKNTALQVPGQGRNLGVSHVEEPQVDEEEAEFQPVITKKVKEKKVRTVPDVPKPDRGWRKALYWLLCRLGRPDIVPGIGRSQQVLLWIEEIRYLISIGVRPVFYVVNGKSGGKTRTALGLASVLAHYVKGLYVTVLPGTSNDTTATLAEMAGVHDQQQITMREIAERPDRFRNFEALDERLPLTRHGVRIISEDISAELMPVDGLESGDNYDVRNFEEVIRVVRPNTGVLIIDGGNDGVSEESITTAAVRMCDVVVGSARETDPASVSRLKRTYLKVMGDIYSGISATEIAGKQLLPRNELPRDGFKALLPGELVPTRHKVARSTLVMNCSTGYSEDQFEQLTVFNNPSFGGPSIPEWEGAGVVVDEDKYLAKKGRVAVTDLFKMSRKTREQYIWLVLMAMREGYAVQRVAEENWLRLEGEVERSRRNAMRGKRVQELVPASSEPVQAATSTEPEPPVASAPRVIDLRGVEGLRAQMDGAFASGKEQP